MEGRGHPLHSKNSREMLLAGGSVGSNLNISGSEVSENTEKRQFHSANTTPNRREVVQEARTGYQREPSRLPKQEEALKKETAHVLQPPKSYREKSTTLKRPEEAKCKDSKNIERAVEHVSVTAVVANTDTDARDQFEREERYPADSVKPIPPLCSNLFALGAGNDCIEKGHNDAGVVCSSSSVTPNTDNAYSTTCSSFERKLFTLPVEGGRTASPPMMFQKTEDEKTAERQEEVSLGDDYSMLQNETLRPENDNSEKPLLEPMQDGFKVDFFGPEPELPSARPSDTSCSLSLHYSGDWGPQMTNEGTVGIPTDYVDDIDDTPEPETEEQKIKDEFSDFEHLVPEDE